MGKQETGELKSRESVAQERERVLGAVSDVCVNAALVNGIVTAYQVALHKTLGAAANAMSQLLITELGDSLSEYVDHLLGATDHKDILESIMRVFNNLKIASDVRYEEVDEKTWRIRIKDSVFKAAHKMLLQRGIELFTLSPEALIIASIIRKHLREEGKGNERVKVEATLTDDEIVIVVQKISSLTRKSR